MLTVEHITESPRFGYIIIRVGLRTWIKGETFQKRKNMFNWDAWVRCITRSSAGPTYLQYMHWVISMSAGASPSANYFKSNATIIEVMQHAKPFYSASAQGFRSPEWDFVIISILRLTMWNSWTHVFQDTVLLYSIVSCQPFVWLRIGSCKLFLHCPSIELNHPTSASVSPPSCWTSMSISIDTHCKYIKDL